MSTACISKIPAAVLERYQQPSSMGGHSDYQADIQRRDLVKLIEGSLLDYQHHSLQTLRACCETLLRMCLNASTHEERFQKVKASNPALTNKIACKATVAVDILNKAGWTQQTLNHEKHYVMTDSHSSRLTMAIEELAKASNLLQDKIQRGESEVQAQKADQLAYREQVLANLQDDRQSRQKNGPADLEPVACYRDRKHGQVTKDEEWKLEPEYVPIHFDKSCEGARRSYREEEDPGNDLSSPKASH